MSKTVSVACKLPNGLAIRVNDVTVVLKGANDSAALLGYGLTHDVSADFLEAWFKEVGPDFAPIKNGLLFAHEKAEKVSDEIREKANDDTVVTGQEPIDPEKPGKTVKGIEKAPAVKE